MSTPPKASGLNIWGDGVGEKTGVEIWRIENMKPVRQPAGDSGKFCTGDSYIVLNTYEVKSSKRQNVHFWLGKESTQDERGAAVRSILLSRVYGYYSFRAISYLVKYAVLGPAWRNGT